MLQRGDRLRRAVRRLHLWLGLGLGGLLVFLGLTGSLLAFYPEIDALLHPEIRIARPNMADSSERDWDRAIATLRAAYPDKQGPWRLEVTGKPGPIPARYYDPPERAGHAFRPMMVWLSPRGTHVLRRDYWGEYPMTFVYDLHYRLALEETGGKVLGWTGFALLALLLSGLWAWWPRGHLQKRWSKSLRFKRRAPPQRTLRDWHKLAGLAGLPLLLVLTVTGIMLELPEESDAALAAVGLPVTPMAHLRAESPEGGQSIPVSHAVRAGRAALPGARLAWIETPPATGGVFHLRMQVPSDPSHRFPHSFVWVDGFSGKVVAVHDARESAGGSAVNGWLHPLHDGSAGGLTGRILVALSGLVPLILFATGLARWRARRQRLSRLPGRANSHRT